MPVREPTRALEALLALTAQLTSDRPLEEFLKLVTDTALDLLGADHASIRLLDASRTALLSGARSGTGAEGRPMSFKRGEGLIGWVVDAGEPIRLDQVQGDSRWVPSKSQTFQVTSLLAEPLWSNGEVIGVLSVSSPTLGAFGDDAQLLLRLCANCSSPPIERARLRRLAMFDDITMAFNHRYLVPRLTEEMERASRSGSDLSVLLMDLDHFKQVNDAHGHAVGDSVLRTFADRVRTHVRRLDVLVRRGGEEFVLIMPSTSAPQAHATGHRIQQAIEEEPIVVEGAHGPIEQTVSIGVATWDGRERPEALDKRADEAMYEAKRLGRNRVVVATPRAIVSR